MIITIDGLDGAGKSTLAKSLSEKLGYEYIDKPIYELFNSISSILKLSFLKVKIKSCKLLLSFNSKWISKWFDFSFKKNSSEGNIDNIQIKINNKMIDIK